MMAKLIKQVTSLPKANLHRHNTVYLDFDTFCNSEIPKIDPTFSSVFPQ